jgi:predicted dehydrogenase
MTYQRDFKDHLRVAVVGLGGHGYRVVLPALNNLPVTLVAVCDNNEERAERTARQYGVRAYSDNAKMLEEKKLDAVLLAVSAFQHPQLALEALGHGVNVWMEKPPAARASDLDDVIAARGDRIVVVGMKKIFMPAGRKALEILADPQAGPLSSVTARYPITVPSNARELLDRPQFSHWLNEGCHPLSLMLAAGGPVESVNVHRGAHGDCACVFGFQGGALGILHLSEHLDLSQPFERYTFVTRGATIEIDNCTRVTLQRGIPYTFGLTTNFAPEGTDTGMVSWEPQNSRSSLENQALFTQGFYAELSYFCEHVRQRRPARRGTLEFARQVMEVYEEVLRQSG